MNSQRGPSQILIWDSTSDRFDLVNPDTSTITCIGITSSRQKRKCIKKIAQHHITDAESATRDLLQATLPIDEMRRVEMFRRLAEATLCQPSHKHHAAGLTERWARVFERGLPRAWSLPSGTQIYDHFSGGGSGSGIKGERQQQTGAQQEQTHGRAGDKRHREEEEAHPRAKRRRHCDLPGAADQEDEDNGEQEEPAEDARQSRRDAETRRAVDQANREEAKRQAQREKEEMQAQREKTEKQQEKERAAAAERVRLQLEAERIAELQAGQQRREREGAEHDPPEEDRAEEEREHCLRLEARQRHERNAQQPWSDAWATFGEACLQLEDPKRRPAEISDLELYTVDFWPTRVGSYESCTLAAVRDFFDNPVTVITRKTMLKLAWLWHPDRSMRHFSHSKDGEVIRDKLTMVTAVINSKLETY